MAVGAAAASTPASCPAPVGSAGMPPSASPMAARGPSAKRTVPDHDSSVSPAVQPWAVACAAAAALISATSPRVISSSPARQSSHTSTWLAMTFVPPGVTSTRPTVARAPARASARTGICAIVAPAATIGSRRPDMRVVPAWLPWPVKRSRQRPWPRTLDATPTGAPRSISPRPCSTCSSRNRPMRDSAASSRPARAGSSPAPASVSASVHPEVSVSASALLAASSPVSSLDPRQGTPKREPSSSANTTTATGRDGRMPLAISRWTASRALTTPSGPSKAPPPGTESRWLPVTSAPGPGGPHQAQMLPLPSWSMSSPIAVARETNHSRSCRSASSNR